MIAGWIHVLHSRAIHAALVAADVKGANVLGRWQHRGENSQLQRQSYFDQTERNQPLNLLDSQHYEYAPPAGQQIPRSVLAEARWRF